MAQQSAPPAAAQASDASLADLRKRLDDTYSKAEIDARLKEKADAKDGVPWWAGIVLGAVLSLLASLGTFWLTRSLDIKKGRSDNTDAAIKEWLAMQPVIANALYLVGHPDEVDEAAFNITKSYGNWFETFALKWKKGQVDVETLTEQNFRTIAKKYWDDFERMQQALEARKVSWALVNTDAEWSNFRWLVT